MTTIDLRDPPATIDTARARLAELRRDELAVVLGLARPDPTLPDRLDAAAYDVWRLEQQPTR